MVVRILLWLMGVPPLVQPTEFGIELVGCGDLPAILLHIRQRISGEELAVVVVVEPQEPFDPDALVVVADQPDRL